MIAKPNKTELTIFVLLLLIPLSIFTFVSSLSVITDLDGNQYYEIRCEDVSQYKAQGYIIKGVDLDGCELVQRKAVVTELMVPTVTANCEAGTSTSYPEWACNSAFNGGKNIEKPWDTEYNKGQLYWMNGDIVKGGACRHFDSGRGVKEMCAIYDYDIRGGMVQVVNTCPFEQNDLLAAETFDSGSSITKFSLRYPVKAFCNAHPAIITDDNSLTSTTSTNIYQNLEDGKTFVVPQGQTMTLFYIIENNANLPTICDATKNLALDLENSEAGVCKSTLGFAYFCSEGQFDARAGLCVVQPESFTKCEKGRFDVVSGTCVYNPPIQVDCQREGAYYSVDRDECIYNPITEYNCPANFVFEEPMNNIQCQEVNGVWDECPQCLNGQICEQNICVPSCSKGQKCVWRSPSIDMCLSYENSTISTGGRCEYLDENGTIQKFYVCSDNLKYDSIRQVCVGLPISKLICDNNLQVAFSPITGKEECVISEMSFMNCPEGTTFSMNKCVSMMAVYNPITGEIEYLSAEEINDFYIQAYKEKIKGGPIKTYALYFIAILITSFICYLMIKKRVK